MRAALIQMQPGVDRDENIEHAISNMHGAADGGAEMVIFAELAVDRFFPQYPCNHSKSNSSKIVAESIPGPTTERLAQVCHARSLVAVFNLYEDAGDGRCFDASPVIDADGQLLGVTRMVHITEYDRFHEKDYYHPGDRGAAVYNTHVGCVGVAICYDRHFPEYMRALGVAGAQIVAIPQAGIIGEWPAGLYEAEVRTAAFQNGYFTALCNRVGLEDNLDFSGESFVVDPEGHIIAQAPQCIETILYTDCDLNMCASSTARQLFWRDRRPELYGDWLK